MHIYISIESLLKMSLESYIESVVSYLTTSGSNCVNPVIATYFYHKKARKRDEKGTGGMYLPDASFFPKG